MTRSLRFSMFAFVAALACALSLGFAGSAWADSYTMTLQTDASATTLTTGDEFTVSEVLSADNATEFTMYALSSQLTFDSTKLELTSVAAKEYVSGKSGVATIQSGTAVFNALSGPFAGTIVSSPVTLCTATFKVIADGESTISFKRASVSTYNGMHSFPVSTVGLTVGQTVAPAPEEETEPGTATTEESTEDSKDQVKKNATTLDDMLDNGKLTKEAVENAEKAGVDLVSLGATQDEIDRAKAGEEVVPAAASEDSKELAEATNANSTSNTTSNTNGASNVNLDINSSSSSSQGNGLPIVPIVIVVIVIVAAIIGGVAYAKSKKKPTAEGELAGSASETSELPPVESGKDGESK